MLGYMCRVRERSHDLIPGEIIIFLGVFDLIPGGESIEYRGDIDSHPLDARFPETNFRFHGNARVNFHWSLNIQSL
jgi:hypothetical protein